MKHTFKVGDVIEGTQTERWLMGRVYKVESGGVLSVDVLDSDKTESHGYPNTWKILAKNATLAKSYVINKILSEI